MLLAFLDTGHCPKGMGTNGTLRSHARCHPYPIVPQPVKRGWPHHWGLRPLLFSNSGVCSFTFHMNWSVKMLWDRTWGFLSLSEKTRKSNHLQISLQRQHFLLIYLKILSVGPAGVWTRDLPLRGPALYQLTELTRRRLINQDWSNIQSKNDGDNSLMSQECTEVLCSFHVQGTKWNGKQIKPLIINAILFIFFEPAIVVNRYMTCALFKLDFEKKTHFF